MAEEFLDKVFHDEGVQLNHVLHLGAEWAQETEIYNKYGAKHVYWVEALLQNRSVAEYHYLNKAKFEWTWIPRAVTDHIGQFTFFLYNHQSANSLYQPDMMKRYYPGHKVESHIHVQGAPLDYLMDHFEVDIPKVNFLCMDIQGAELVALQYADVLLKSKNLKYICAEVVTEPLYQNACLYDDIKEILEPYGFFPKYEQQHHPTYNVPSVPQYDVFFVRIP